MTLIKLRTKRFTVCDIVFVRKHIKTTFGRQWGYHTITGRLQIPTRASRQKFCLARVFSPMAPSLDGERTRQLANTLFGTK